MDNNDALVLIATSMRRIADSLERLEQKEKVPIATLDSDLDAIELFEQKYRVVKKDPPNENAFPNFKTKVDNEPK